jgi:hypothetical protein
MCWSRPPILILPISASQVARIMGVSYCVQLLSFLKNFFMLLHTHVLMPGLAGTEAGKASACQPWLAGRRKKHLTVILY